MEKNILNIKFNSHAELLFEIIDKKISITQEQIKSKTRTRTLADIRRVIINILKKSNPKATVYEIAAVVNRDHSSVSTQTKEHFKLYGNNKEYSGLFDFINNNFQNILNSNKPLVELYKDRNYLESRLEIVNQAIVEMESNKENFRFLQ